MTNSQKSVLLSMGLLRCTNNPVAAWQNVAGGKKAWEELVADKLILKDGVYYVLSPSGKEELNNLVVDA